MIGSKFRKPIVCHWNLDKERKNGEKGEKDEGGVKR